MENNKYKECCQDLPIKDVVKIKHKITGKIPKVVESKNLRYADLRYADLRYANTKFCVVNFSSDEYKQAKQFIEGLKSWKTKYVKRVIKNFNMS